MGGDISSDIFKNYKIIRDKNIKNCIKADHAKRELYVSEEISLKRTDDGSLSAEFANFRNPKNTKLLGFNIPQKSSKYDCSIVISDPTKFNSCLQQQGVYQLSGSNLIFNGTKNDDSLILNGISNSDINMQDGNDTVICREKQTFNNNIDLGNGNNVFSTEQKPVTDTNKPLLINNRISSGKGEDYISLRDAVDNTVSTGKGKDLVEINGGVNPSSPRTFSGNNINTENDNDTVTVNGNFGNTFRDNKFNLGKGSDTFSASINPEDDAQSTTEYGKKLLKYTSAVQGNEIYTEDGEKKLFGFGGNNTFETQTHTANFLNEYFNSTACSKGFQNYVYKPVPKTQILPPQEQVSQKAPVKLTRDDYARRYSTGSLGYMLFKDPKMLEFAFKALDDYVKSME